MLASCLAGWKAYIRVCNVSVILLLTRIFTRNQGRVGYLVGAFATLREALKACQGYEKDSSCFFYPLNYQSACVI